MMIYRLLPRWGFPFFSFSSLFFVFDVFSVFWKARYSESRKPVWPEILPRRGKTASNCINQNFNGLSPHFYVICPQMVHQYPPRLSPWHICTSCLIKKIPVVCVIVFLSLISVLKTKGRDFKKEDEIQDNISEPTQRSSVDFSDSILFGT